MNGKFYLLECGDNDVLSFGEDTYKVHKLKKALNQSLTSDKYLDINSVCCTKKC